MTEKPQNITSISGKRLREARKSVKLTQEQLSELANISVQHLSYIECGKRRLTADTANILSPYLNVCPPYLMGEIDFKTINEQLKANKNYCETSCDFIVKFFNFIDLNIDFLCSIDSNSEYQPKNFMGLYTQINGSAVYLMVWNVKHS
ncbi:XRE family transcriptional regulator [Hungatella hathewayi]|nr:XRE family transcriptional regulator [Hungatella hathewayi]